MLHRHFSSPKLQEPRGAGVPPADGGTPPPFSRRTLIVVLAAFALGATLHAEDKPKRVVTTFTILQDIAQNVAGNAATVDSITKPGAEIHEYEPTPGDIVKAQSADLVIWNGLGLERWF